jgi:hypothetical protein
MRAFDKSNTITCLATIVVLCGCGPGALTPPASAPPQKLQGSSGDGQTGNAGTMLQGPLVVRVTDSSGAPVAGSAIDFAVVEGGGSLSAASVQTDARGEASVHWILGTQAGAPQSARATLSGRNDVAVAFRASAIAGPLAKVAVEPANPSFWAGATTQMTAVSQDQFGNVIGPATAVWSSSDLAIASVSPTGVVRGIDLGVAVVTATVNGIAGSTRVVLSDVLAATGTPTIDGVMANGEWDASARLRFMMNVPGGGRTPATLLVLHDAKNLYLGVQFVRSAIDPGNSLAVELDSNGNGILDSGDDVIVLNPSVGFVDSYRTSAPPCPSGGGLCGLMDVDLGGTNDGDGRFANDGVTSFYEVAHPLSSGDPHDISIGPGRWIGLFTSIRILDASGYYDTRFPVGYLRVHIGQ